MPRTAVSESAKIRQYVRDYPELQSVNGVLTCTLCLEKVNHERTQYVHQHIESGGHKRKIENKAAKQPLLPIAVNHQAKTSEFNYRIGNPQALSPETLRRYNGGDQR